MKSILFYFLYFFLTFIQGWETETQSVTRGGAEREDDTESEAGRRALNAGLELTNSEIMTWAEVGHLTDWATQAPWINLF